MGWLRGGFMPSDEVELLRSCADVGLYSGRGRSGRSLAFERDYSKRMTHADKGATTVSECSRTELRERVGKECTIGRKEREIER